MPDAQGRLVVGDPNYIAPATGGLINSGTMGQTPPTIPTAYSVPTNVSAVPAVGRSYTPDAYTVGPDQTVAGHVRNIINEDSPLMQQAAARARGMMNDRGLLNTSMAVGATQGALLDRALPIAAQDANTYATAATNTTNARNTSMQFGANADNAASTTNAGLGTQTNLTTAAATNAAAAAAAAATNTSALESQRQAGNTSLQTLQGTQARDLATLNNTATAALNVTLQNSRNAAAFDTAALQASVNAATAAGANVTSLANAAASQIAAIELAPNLTPEQRQNMIAGVTSRLQTNIATIVQAYTIPLGDTLTFEGQSPPTPVPGVTPPPAAVTPPPVVPPPAPVAPPPGVSPTPAAPFTDVTPASTNIRSWVADASASGTLTPAAVQAALNATGAPPEQQKAAMYAAGAGVLTPAQINQYMGW